jgi:hypothetical protein
MYTVLIINIHIVNQFYHLERGVRYWCECPKSKLGDMLKLAKTIHNGIIIDIEYSVMPILQIVLQNLKNTMFIKIQSISTYFLHC